MVDIYLFTKILLVHSSPGKRNILVAMIMYCCDGWFEWGLDCSFHSSLHLHVACAGFPLTCVLLALTLPQPSLTHVWVALDLPWSPTPCLLHYCTPYMGLLLLLFNAHVSQRNPRPSC